MTGTAAQLLCIQCGLCCSGAIFADVELGSQQEAAAMEILGLDIEEEGGRSLLIQPCRALRGTECGIYVHRPECCRSFECRLLKDFRSGDISLVEATRVIRDLVGKLAGQDQESARRMVDSQFLNRSQ